MWISAAISTHPRLKLNGDENSDHRGLRHQTGKPQSRPCRLREFDGENASRWRARWVLVRAGHTALCSRRRQGRHLKMARRRHPPCTISAGQFALSDNRAGASGWSRKAAKARHRDRRLRGRLALAASELLMVRRAHSAVSNHEVSVLLSGPRPFENACLRKAPQDEGIKLSMTR